MHVNWDHCLDYGVNLFVGDESFDYIFVRQNFRRVMMNLMSNCITKIVGSMIVEMLLFC